MRRLSRLDRSIDWLRPRQTSSSSSFLCSACLHRAPLSTSIRCLAEPDKVPRTERLRRKIWGTDEPPGLNDPYGGPSIVEERQAARAALDGKLVQGSQLQQSKTAAPILDASYEPSKTWDGLEEVGELPAPEFYFEGFMPAEKVTDPYQATAALHRAVVEVLILRQAGRPLSELSNVGRAMDNTSDVQISVSQSNPSAPVLKFSAGPSEEAILESLSQREQGAEAEESTEDVFEPETSDEASIMESNTTTDQLAEDESPEAIEALQLTNYEHQVASWNPSWLQVSLEDAEIKFAVVKRVMQLTGICIPDSAINSAHTARAILTHITQKPKPAKVFDALAERQDLVSLPNVMIYNRRITPIDKEKMVGRWKIIENELNSRGLPLTGHS